MAYDFNNIAYIKRADGTEIKQIKKGTTTLWTKPYVWEKYYTTTVTETTMGWEAYEANEWNDFEDDYERDLYDEDWFNGATRLYKNYKIDSDGNFVGTGGYKIMYSPNNLTSYWASYPYLLYVDDGGIMFKFIKVESLGEWEVGSYYMAKCHMVEYATEEAEITESVTKKGTYIQNISNSTNSYPEDGISGSYWYTLISSPNAPGFNPSTSGSYSVEDVSGATYGFVLNSNGYYESTNNGVDYSYSICKVNININKTASLYIDCINYAETNYDFGILSNLNTSLSLDDSADTTNVKKSFKGSSSSAIQTVSYGSLSAGSYYIYIKFRKDSSQSSNNDSLQFKVRIE